MKNKGQMFLITAAIIIVILVLLKTGINLPDILQREKEVKSRFEKEFFLNIVDELVKVVDISYHQSSNITSNVFNFGNFTKKKMTERLQNFNFFYVGSITPATQGSDTMNVSVINLLNKNTSVILNLNGTIKEPTPSATTTAVDTGIDVGRYSSIAIDSNDKVHISYKDYSFSKLKYCNNTLGLWTCATIDPDPDIVGGDYSSIAIDSNDKVHISYKDYQYENLRYCNNTAGAWTCIDVETGGFVGHYSSIAIDSNDKVHISHLNNTNGNLRYCNNTADTWTCIDVETGSINSGYSSIAIDSNDKVHISHQNTTDDDLRYCNNTLGTWTCTDIETGGFGMYSSIAIDSNDKVHISHYNDTDHSLRYCNNTAGAWTCIDVETGGPTSGYSSIAIDSNDKPYISHWNCTFLKYCYTDDFSTWNCRFVYDTGAILTNGRAIAVKKGRLCDSTSFSKSVHISYYYQPDNDLMYAEIVHKLEDSSSWDINFTINQGNDYTLIVNYDDNQENISIGTKINKSVHIGFFDITLIGSETTYKDKFQKNYTLP